MFVIGAEKKNYYDVNETHSSPKWVFNPLNTDKTAANGNLKSMSKIETTSKESVSEACQQDKPQKARLV